MGNRWATHDPAPAARRDGAEGPELACATYSASQTATSRKRRGYLVMKGSAVRIRAAACPKTHIGTGFRHHGCPSRRPPTPTVATPCATGDAQGPSDSPERSAQKWSGNPGPANQPDLPPLVERMFQQRRVTGVENMIKPLMTITEPARCEVVLPRRVTLGARLRPAPSPPAACRRLTSSAAAMDRTG